MKAEELKKEAESAALEAYRKYLAWQKAEGEENGDEDDADLDSFSDWISHEFMTEHLDEADPPDTGDPPANEEVDGDG